MTVPAYYDLCNHHLLRLLPRDARLIVEVGCGAGALAAEYKKINPAVSYLGLERHGLAAQKASERLDRVVQGDAEALELDQLGIEAGTVDCLVYGDVLEHLTDPWSLLQRQASWLKPDGLVLASVPNVGHWTVLLPLLCGRWRYQDQGLLDRTHLRFFTGEGVIDLFSRAGLQLHDLLSVEQINEHYARFRELLAPVARVFGVEEDRFIAQTGTFQFLVRAGRAPLPSPTLLIQTRIGESEDSARLRVHEPDQFLATIPGVRLMASKEWMDLSEDLPGEDKIFIWQRHFPRDPSDLRRLQLLLSRGYLVLADIDDDPRGWPGWAANDLASLRSCHAVQTSTEPLGAYLRRYNPHVGVFSNQLAALPPLRCSADDECVSLFCGALNADADWQPLLPALNEALAKHGSRIQVRVLSNRPFFDALQTPAKTFDPFGSYPQSTDVLRQCHIAFLPLEPTPANELKSDLPFLECAGHGVVALASPTVYGGSIADGETGCLFRSPQEFSERLSQLIHDQALRGRLADNAYAMVRQHRLLSQHYRKRYDWYRELCASMPQLNAELRQRAPELFGGQEAVAKPQLRASACSHTERRDPARGGSIAYDSGTPGNGAAIPSGG
jgi:SAM-dependent methyltransferase